MAKGCATNTYEEARKQRLEENRKRFEDLGISKISKKLSELVTPEKKAPPQCRPKQKSNSNDVVEPRRSSRVRNSVPSYREEVFIDLPPLRKRSRSSSSWGSYVARPLDEIKEATDEERNRAFMAAETLLSDLQTSNPAFIKSMVRSHVYSCFWLGLPNRFCHDHLPKTTCDMILEDENGSEFEAVFLGNRTGLSGGWRGFALDHKLDDGDALVFELVEPTRFKIYIVKAFPESAEDGQEILDEQVDTCATKKHKPQSNKTKILKQGIVHETKESANSQEYIAENNADNGIEPQGLNTTRKTRFSQRKSQKESEDCKLLPSDGSIKEENIEQGKNCTPKKATSQANKTRSKRGTRNK
ncbi:putative B3 domain-containing protein At5g58280 [Neltuma alba]|uniref:putative B3 domain-containing protein At5g58280 n=1 Tax=Neltuma alba TaxID=207710 RepID=UPI0010A2EA70|nr:putative B3 domain-containing protein At5g58280 [Prosopis alba]